MIIAITLIAIAAVMAVSLASGGRDLNFTAREVNQATRARQVRR